MSFILKKDSEYHWQSLILNEKSIVFLKISICFLMNDIDTEPMFGAGHHYTIYGI